MQRFTHILVILILTSCSDPQQQAGTYPTGGMNELDAATINGGDSNQMALIVAQHNKPDTQYSHGISSEEKVREYLLRNFPDGDTINQKSLVYRNFEVESIRTPVFTRKTGSELFKTELVTGYYEYPLLEIAVILASDDQIEILESPTFGEANKEFIDLLECVCVDKSEDKMVITNELSNIFKEITYNGAIVNIEFSENGTSCELKHGQLLWRKLNFIFDKDCLKEVSVINPKE